MERLIIPGFYLACVLFALALAWMSRKPDLIQTGFILLAGWACHNAAVELHGAATSPLLIPTMDTILALCMAGVAVLHHSKVAVAVFGLFVLVQIVHITAFEAHTQGTYFYFLTLNLLFLAQVLLIGGNGAWSLVVDHLAEPPRMADRLRVFLPGHGPRVDHR